MDSITASDRGSDGDPKMAVIFLTNLPHDCRDHELRVWLESRGIEVVSTRIILDLETGVDPAFGYVELKDPEFVKAGAEFLNGRILRSNKIMAKPVQIVPRDFNRSTVNP
jgi:RNA recognition motif-containing protein